MKTSTPIYVHLVGSSTVELWYLNSRMRIERQLKALNRIVIRVDALEEIPPQARVLLLRADYLFEVRTLTELILQADCVLFHPDDSLPAAAWISQAQAAATHNFMTGEGPAVDGLIHLTPTVLGSFDHQLRKAKAPLLEPLREDRSTALEALLYGTAYKGITDLVTKYLWPTPARHGVRWCSRIGITPNQVTALGFILMLIATYLFAHGQYAVGLICGWIMTYLDTVDGKLARVTVQSSQFGHYFDHGMDIIHPPFWYVLWGSGLATAPTLGGLDIDTWNWLIIGGYIAGRLIEVVFHLLGSTSLFSWRPFDSYFRLVTARRNPCLILMTLFLAFGRADLAFVSVAAWTVLSSVIMTARLVQGTLARVRGPLKPWLTEPDLAAQQHPRAFRTFSTTQSAYLVR